MDRLEGHWLGELAAVDARGAAGAEHGVQAGSTAAWLRHRLRMGAGTAAGLVRTARALPSGAIGNAACGWRRPGRAWSPSTACWTPRPPDAGGAGAPGPPSRLPGPRSGGQRRADGLTELARRTLEGGRLPQAGGVRSQLPVTVELASLLGHPGGVGPLEPEACRRLACDGAVTRCWSAATGPAITRAPMTAWRGGWRLARDPDGRLAATLPHRRPQRAPAAA